MKAIAAIATLLMAANVMAAGSPSAGIPVHVYVSYGAPLPGLLLTQAWSRASALLAPSGVSLTWHTGPIHCPPGSVCLRMSFVPKATAANHVSRDALAEAWPYASGHEIAIFNDRVTRLLDAFSSSRGTILGYILAHEICHVLEGIARHSDTGLMRARWGSADYLAMKRGTLGLAEIDCDLVRKTLR